MLYKKYSLLICAFISVGLLMYCVPKARYFVHKQFNKHMEVDSANVPAKNLQLLKNAATKGPNIAPTYQKAVCTEYVIQLLSDFVKLNSAHKSQIRIITKENIDTLLHTNSSIPKGVVFALTQAGYGKEVTIENAKAGDLVQFWNHYRGKTTGHCGIVRAIDLKKGLISLYSSSPSTDGHGEQVYILPDYIWFVRLK